VNGTQYLEESEAKTMSAAVGFPKILAEIRIKTTILTLLIVGACFGQEQQPIQDLNVLVGKQVIAQRVPLCRPGTFTTVVTYAGKQAKVLSLKPFNLPHLSEKTMSRMSPEARTMMKDQQRAATILVEFEDGTKLDSCGPVSPGRLPDWFELVPGQTLEVASTAPATPSSSTTMPTQQSTQSAGILSDDEVRQALNGKGKGHWVSIEDMGLMAAQGNQVPKITLYMTDAVLAIGAESAKKQFINYEPTEEDKKKSLMIVAYGYAGKTIAEGCTPITRVVLLSDPSGGVVEEAYLSEPSSQVWRNNFGAINDCQALRTKFSLEAVEKVRTAASNGEFFVAVFSGTVNTKTYKIKRKHQSKLDLQ
jgi:hypothetical protein